MGDKSSSYRTIMDNQTRLSLRTGLLKLRPIFTGQQAAIAYLHFFDEFVREEEFGLALNTVCDYLLESDTPTPSDSLIDQIHTLHSAMEVDDDCVTHLREKAASGK